LSDWISSNHWATASATQEKTELVSDFVLTGYSSKQAMYQLQIMPQDEVMAFKSTGIFAITIPEIKDNNRAMHERKVGSCFDTEAE
jgi:hypothetical protein